MKKGLTSRWSYFRSDRPGESEDIWLDPKRRAGSGSAGRSLREKFQIVCHKESGSHFVWN
jgi:hypothetical protein